MPLFEHFRRQTADESAVVFSPSGPEFRALPEKVQFQCFSEVERLRYAHGLADSSASAPTTPTKSFGRPRLHTTARPSTQDSRGTSLSLLRSLGSKKPLTAEQISREDALWFSKLPEKVRRGQFSIQEQAAFAGKLDDIQAPKASERSIFYLADEHKSGSSGANRSLPSLASSLSSRSSTGTHNEIEGWIEATTATNDKMDDAMRESMKWADSSVDLSLDDYHQQLVVEQSVTSHKPRPSFGRRGKSLSNFVLRKQSMDVPSAMPSPLRIAPGLEKQLKQTISTPPVPKLPHFSKSALASPTVSSMSSGTETTITTITTKATHYQDPEARMKLRMYLASPQNFDEAVEFGFPALQSPPPTEPEPTRPSTAHQEDSTTSPFAAKAFLSSKIAALKAKINTPLPEAYFDTNITLDTQVTETQIDQTDNVSLLSYPAEADEDELTPTATPAPHSVSSLGASTKYIMTGPIEREMKKPLAWRSLLPTSHPSLESTATTTTTTTTSSSDSTGTILAPTPTAHSTPKTSVSPLSSTPAPKTQHASALSNTAWDDLLHEDLPGREMTLRMTLTRPDLRADEKVLYPNVVIKGMDKVMGERDPLRLEDLPILDGSDARLKSARESHEGRFAWGRGMLKKIGL